MSLDKVRKEKEELRDSNSQLKCYINDLKATMSALRETLLSCSCRAEIAESQAQNLILQVVELQINFPTPQGVYC